MTELKFKTEVKIVTNQEEADKLSNDINNLFLLAHPELDAMSKPERKVFLEKKYPTFISFIDWINSKFEEE
jgi:hypothetical protein